MDGSIFAVPALVLGAVAGGAAFYSGSQIFLKWYSSYEEDYVQRTEDDLFSMFSSLSPQRVLQWSLGCFGVMFVLTLLAVGRFDSTTSAVLSLGFATILGLLATTLPRLMIKQGKVMRLKKFDLQLLDALLSMSNALKAGFSIIQAFESIVEEGKNPIAQEFDLLLRETRLGVKFEVASENLAKRMPSEDLNIVLAGIEVARQTGGNLTEVFDRLAVVIRERMRVQGRIQSLTSQGRLQGWVVGLMPFGLAVVLYMLQPSMMEGFVRSPIGIMAIFAMLCLQALGFYAIRKIVAIDV